MEHSGLISVRMDWLDLLAVQGALKSLLQHHSSKASILRLSAFFRVQLSHPYMTTGKTIALNAAAAAKSLQSCPTLCDPIDGSPPGFPSLGFSRQEHWSGLPFPSPMHESEKSKWSCSVVSDSEPPHRLQPTRLLRPWDFPGKSTGVGAIAFSDILNQSILKEISPEYSLEGLMLKLELQCFGHLMQRTASVEKTLMAGKDWR